MHIFMIFISLFVLFYVIAIYNGLIKHKNLVKEAWSGIDVQLKKRYDLVFNLVDIVKSYADFEKSTIESIIGLRTKCIDAKTETEQENAENELTMQLKRFLFLVERYPELKASELYLNLHKNLVDIENDIQHSRRYYNGTVRDYNTFIEVFPNIIISNIMGFKQKEFFKIILATERENIDVSKITKE